METLQVRLTEQQVKGLDVMVRQGVYSSRGEAVRDAVRRLEILTTIQSLQKLAKDKGVTREELIGELNKVGNELYAQKA
jgi:Arc/MetJ-type ribon-helix-helix transcriptional regulator